MKTILLTVAFMLGFIVSSSAAQDISVLVKPKAQSTTINIVIVPWIATPAPAPSLLKPRFKTPIRDGIWYYNLMWQQALQQNRQQRYDRLGELLDK